MRGARILSNVKGYYDGCGALAEHVVTEQRSWYWHDHHRPACLSLTLMPPVSRGVRRGAARGEAGKLEWAWPRAARAELCRIGYRGGSGAGRGGAF